MLKVKKDQLLRRFPQFALVSFIAACSEAPKKELVAFAGGFTSRVGGGGSPPLSFEAGALSKDESGFTAAGGGGTDSLTVEIEKANADTATLTFADATKHNVSFGRKFDVTTTGIYKLTTTLDQYDLVVATPSTSNVSGSDDYRKGNIFIFWDVAGIKNETIGGTAANNARLEIKGATKEAYIGTHLPEFLKLGGTDNNYDMIIRSERVDGAKGGIYILWDVAEYAEATKTIDLGKLGNTNNAALDATSGFLAIYGVNTADLIGGNAPEFLKLGGTDNNYDMIIRASVHKTDGVSQTYEGAIYILWDVTAYAGNKTINLGTLDQDDSNTSLGEGATAGSLAIYGAKQRDFIGTYAPKFLQLAGKADNYDMVIRSEYVDNAGEGDNGLLSNNTDEGAIYVLWDVEDYVAGVNKNQSIDLATTTANATSGLLTIYGKDQIPKVEDDPLKQGLGHDNNDILYDTDAAGNKVLANIGEGVIKDIVFRDKDYTYILFGDKVANDTDGDYKVDSKTIDLTNIGPLVDKDDADATSANEGFFSYDFDGASGSAAAVDRVGYRFADRKADLAEVQTAYDTATSPAMPLSDADADLAVWDIA